jgi:predicted dehydrogenase
MTQHIKPEIYPKVEDEATIVVAYPQAQGIIQASWNLPFDQRKMEVYGSGGYVVVPQMDLLRMRQAGTEESELNLPARPGSDPSGDDISYFAAVVRGDIQPSGPSSLKVNLVTTEILDAARKSAQSGMKIDLPQNPPR